jgi:ribosomal protein S1
MWFQCEDVCSIFRRIIKAKFLHPKDLQPGMKVSCEIKEHIQTGAFVTIDGGGRHLTGFVRSLHLGSVPLQHPEKKYPVRSQHSARVRTFEIILK